MQKFEKSTRLLTVNKYLPHNFLAEKIILSSLLISTEAIENTLRKITIEAFYFKNHQSFPILPGFDLQYPLDFSYIPQLFQ